MGHATDRRARAARHRRADAERNIEAILNAALQTAPSDGGFTMTAIARAAGLSRVTLYAHFPTRQALIEAVLRRCVALASNALGDLALDEGPATEALARLLRSAWQILDRHRHLYLVASAALPPARLRAYHEPVLGRVERLVARGQAAGVFRTDLPRDWLVETIYTLMHLAADRLNAGRLPADRSGDIVTTSVLSLLDVARSPTLRNR